MVLVVLRGIGGILSGIGGRTGQRAKIMILPMVVLTLVKFLLFENDIRQTCHLSQFLILLLNHCQPAQQLLVLQFFHDLAWSNKNFRQEVESGNWFTWSEGDKMSIFTFETRSRFGSLNLRLQDEIDNFVHLISGFETRSRISVI